MAERVSSPSAAASPATIDSVIAELARTSGTVPGGQSIVVDRSVSPYGGPRHVSLPDCCGCAHASSREPALPSSEDQIVWQELIEDHCRARIIAERGPAALVVAGMPDARAFIDSVEGGLARMIQPGFADIAGIACPDLRADVMLALGWLQPKCPCLKTLLQSLPSDTVQGLYASADVRCSHGASLDDLSRDEQRRQQKSADWSAFLLAKAEDRRRPPVGDLFDAFEVVVGDSDPSAPTPVEPWPDDVSDTEDDSPPWDEDPVEPTPDTAG